jgi:hypothetical protein
MEYLNINNLFGCNAPINDNPLSLKDLDRSQHNKKQEFNIQSLVNKNKEHKEYAYKKYKELYEYCLSKISVANKIGKNEIMFEIPSYIYRAKSYDSVECLKYIKGKLEKMNIETYIISKTSILISWINIK